MRYFLFYSKVALFSNFKVTFLFKLHSLIKYFSSSHCRIDISLIIWTWNSHFVFELDFIIMFALEIGFELVNKALWDDTVKFTSDFSLVFIWCFWSSLYFEGPKPFSLWLIINVDLGLIYFIARISICFLLFEYLDSVRRVIKRQLTSIYLLSLFVILCKHTVITSQILMPRGTILYSQSWLRSSFVIWRHFKYVCQSVWNTADLGFEILFKLSFTTLMLVCIRHFRNKVTCSLAIASGIFGWLINSRVAWVSY